MIRLAWRSLLVRGGQTLALAAAVLVAATGFTVLTASAQASRLETVGTVQANARTAYDILVRPEGARSEIETSQGLVQPGFLGGTTGGITTAEWEQVLDVPGVEVAAPIAVVGVVAPRTEFFVDTTALASRERDTALRIDGRWTLADGTVLEQQPTYVLTTPAAVGAPVPPPPSKYEGACSREDLEGLVYPPLGRTVSTAPTIQRCFFNRKEVKYAGGPPGRVGRPLLFPLPMVLVGVDPSQESALVGLDDASDIFEETSLEAALQQRTKKIPLLTAADSPVKARLDVSVEGLPSSAVETMTSGLNLAELKATPGVVVERRTIEAGEAYAQALDDFAELRRTEYGILQYWTPSQARYELQRDGDLAAVPAENDMKQVSQALDFFAYPPAGTELTKFRTLENRRLSGSYGPIPFSVGSFDPQQLQGLEEVTAQILAGYATAPTTGADARSRELLGDEPVAGSTNMGALVQPPPTLVTGIDSVPELTGYNFGSPAGGAPISAIRVRVEGVTGVDDLSRERVRLAAQRIRSATGLDVDVTVGASTVEKILEQPSEVEGQEPLRLRQTWVKLGVGVTIIEALDQKSVALFVLVLLVSALSVANSAVASVRSRRTHLGVLACVGWTRAALFGSVAHELGIVAVIAGLLSGVLALGVGELVGTPIGWARAALAVPAAIGVTLVAGLVPAMLAARSNPLDAVHPVIAQGRRPRRIRSLAAMAWANLTRVRSRTVLAVAALAVATAVFTLLLAVALGFQGAVVGSALGDAVAIQARGADYAACAATLLLAGLGVANLMYLNIRDRGEEVATLRAVGWTEGHLRRMLLVEGALLGLFGGLAGAAAGYAGAWLLVGDLPGAVLAGAALAALTSVVIAATATLGALTLLSRLPTMELLTE